MSGSIADLRAAADADTGFGFEACRELDKTVRGRSSKRFAEITPTQFEILHLRLSSIASIHRTQAQMGKFMTPRQRQVFLKRVECNTLNILSLLGIGVHSHPHDLPFEHICDNGIFEDTEIHIESVIEALQTVALNARKGLDKLKGKAKPQTRSANVYLYRLYDDLGVVYTQYWGDLRISVNEDKGGPAVRFYQFTLDRILGLQVTARSVKDTLSAMKREHSAGSARFRIFSDASAEEMCWNVFV